MGRGRNRPGAGALLRSFRQSRRIARFLAMPTDEERKLTAEFKRRRASWLRLQVSGGALVIGSGVVGAAFPSIPEWIPLTLIGIALFGLAIAGSIANYRCPRCDAWPYVGDNWMAPDACEKCGLDFK
jgi:hypothetical protein